MTSGSLTGTASLASNSLLLQGTGSIGFATTASMLEVSSSQQQISSSQQQISASLLNVVANYATTGSNSFRADQSITGSLVVSSTITAQTLVVQTVTSSIVYSSGSNIFGSALGDRQTFTGSVNITGSLSLNNIAIPTSASLASTYLPLAGGTLTGALSGTSATLSSSLTIGNTFNINTEAWIRFLGNNVLLADGDFTILQTSGTGLMRFRNNSAQNLLTLANNGAATFSSSVTMGGDLVLTPTDSAISFSSGAARFFTGGQEKMRITSGNDVGIGATTITNPNSIGRVLELKLANSVGIVLNDSRDASPICLENRGAVFHLTYGTKNLLVSDGTSGNLTVNTYANITGGTFNVPASTTKTVTVAFNGGNIHAFLGFSSQSGGITGAGAKSIFLGGTTNDGSGHTPTVISTFSYGDQVVGAATTNTSTGFTFTITNNKGSAVSWSWSAFGSYGSITVS
jgi:hypothetical protein